MQGHILKKLQGIGVWGTFNNIKKAPFPNIVLWILMYIEEDYLVSAQQQSSEGPVYWLLNMTRWMVEVELHMLHVPSLVSDISLHTLHGHGPGFLKRCKKLANI